MQGFYHRRIPSRTKISGFSWSCAHLEGAGAQAKQLQGRVDAGVSFFHQLSEEVVMKLLSASIAAAFTVALAVSQAFAQEKKEEVPFWAIGRPAGEVTAKMAPVPAFPIATAADKLPVKKIKLPPGFKVEVYQAGILDARGMREGDKGTVFVSSLFVAGKIYAITDKGGKRELKTIAEKLFLPNGIESVVKGMRNTVGFDWHPATKELWFGDNQRDWLSEDMPLDELNRVTKPGQHFGFPYCHSGMMVDPQFGWGKDCKNYVKPALTIGAHAAPLGMRFYTGKMFPEKYHNAIFLTRHGPWNRTQKYAADVVAIFIDAKGNAKMEPFLTGLVENNGYLGRPADVR